VAPFRILAALALSGIVTGCSGAGRFLREAFRERPPTPLDSMSVASDARIDSLGYIVGSFVGEGTSRAVHLLSSDTGFIASLARRYRPSLGREDDLWHSLARERVVTLAPGGPRRATTGTPLVARAVAGGPAGQTAVTPSAILLHGSWCGWRGAQAEIIVEDDHRAQEPPLRGPVLGSLTHPDVTNPPGGSRQPFRWRDPLPEAGMSLRNELIGRTARVMDSTLDSRLPSLRIWPPTGTQPEVNTLADIDAADIVAYRAAPGAVRFAISLRLRRITAGGDTLLAATVMAWDSAGAWQQVIFRPALVSLRRGRLAPYGTLRRGLFWRRLQPINDFGFQRDNLWMEQVDVRDGSVLWGIIQPKGNVVVAAAEVEGPCS
ncbi:MAG: hypothetical protein ACJ8BF_04575, partial [Gemmatimonadales bacterium]